MERKNIPFSELELGDRQSRVYRNISDGLVESIENDGLLQNIVVREGEDNYKVIAGSRRFIAAERAGLGEIPCAVVEANDMEATRVSLAENTQREDLTQYETVRSVKMWYDVLCEELPQANEEGEFESPIEEGKTFDSRQGLKTHVKMSEGSPNFDDPLIEEDVKKKIEEQSPYGYSTVKQLIRLGKLPHKILILLKTQEERTSDEQETVEERFKSDYSFGGDKSTAVSTKFLEIDKLLRKVDDVGLSEELYPQFVYTVLERRNIDSDSTLLDIRSEFNDVAEKYEGWKGEVIEQSQIDKAAEGEEPPVDDEADEETVTETEGEEKEETVNRVKENFTSPSTEDDSDDSSGESDSDEDVSVKTFDEDDESAKDSQDDDSEESQSTDVDDGFDGVDTESSWTSDSEIDSDNTEDEDSEKTEDETLDGKFVIECFGETVNSLVGLTRLVETSDFTAEEAEREAEVTYKEQ